MNMPSFTAAASVYRTNQFYRMRRKDAIATGQVVPQRQKRPDLLQTCKTECKKDHQGDLQWATACDDFCRCLHMSDNEVSVCAQDFKDDTGQSAAVFRRPPVLDWRSTVVRSR